MKALVFAAAAAGLFSHAALAGPAFGTDSLVQNPAVGVTCNGNLAPGVTCNNNTSLSGTGTILLDGGQTGDFTAIPTGTLVSDTQLTSSIGQSYSFTSAFGSFTGILQSVTPSGFGNLTALADFFTGTFTPSFGGFDPGDATLAVAYTQAIVADVTSWSVSDTLSSLPEVVPEPTSLAILGAALVAMGWRGRARKQPPRISASAV